MEASPQNKHNLVEEPQDRQDKIYDTFSSSLQQSNLPDGCSNCEILLKILDDFYEENEQLLKENIRFRKKNQALRNEMLAKGEGIN